MNVGFYLTGAIPTWVPLMMQSIRATMPKVPVVQFTDETSTQVPSVDETYRLPPAPLSLHRARHFANVTGEWLFLDTDVIVQRDVRNVFASPFDVAVTDRHWSRAPNGQFRAGGQPDYIAKFPYNAGVIFSRCPEFWRESVRELTSHPAWQINWNGDQHVLCQLAQSGRYKVRVLPGQIYNFPPDTASEPEIANAAILHYKGKQRKALLQQRVRHVA